LPFDINGEHATHIFSYNYVQVDEPDFMEPIVKRLNRTKFKLLAWCVDVQKCNKYNLKNVELVKKLPLTTWGKRSHMIYIYAKALPKN